MSNATVTIAYDEFQKIKNEKAKAEETAAKLRQEVIQARIESSDPHLLALARAALDIVRYAVASMPPESNRGWPFESLRVVAVEVMNMPDATPDHHELSITLRNFADECEKYERRRMALAQVKQAPVPTLEAISKGQPSTE